MNPSQSGSNTFDILQINRNAATRSKKKKTRSLIAGGALVGFAVARRSWFGLLAGAYGVELLVGALTERPLSEHVRELLRDIQAPRHRFGNGTRDRVDEASWESFPASDPSAVP